MGKIYAKAIVADARSLDSIGTMWRAATIKALEDMAAKGEITEDELAGYLGE